MFSFFRLHNCRSSENSTILLEVQHAHLDYNNWLDKNLNCEMGCAPDFFLGVNGDQHSTRHNNFMW